MILQKKDVFRNDLTNLEGGEKIVIHRGLSNEIEKKITSQFFDERFNAKINLTLSENTTIHILNYVDDLQKYVVGDYAFSVLQRKMIDILYSICVEKKCNRVIISENDFFQLLHEGNVDKSGINVERELDMLSFIKIKTKFGNGKTVTGKAVYGFYTIEGLLDNDAYGKIFIIEPSLILLPEYAGDISSNFIETTPKFYQLPEYQFTFAKLLQNQLSYKKPICKLTLFAINKFSDVFNSIQYVKKRVVEKFLKQLEENSITFNFNYSFYDNTKKEIIEDIKSVLLGLKPKEIISSKKIILQFKRKG